MFRAYFVAFYVAMAAIAALLCIFGYLYGRLMPFAQQWPLYEALRNTASIIFAVVGAWLAIIYPERLKLSFRGDKRGGGTNGNLGLLLTPAIHSTIILVILLFIGVSANLLKFAPFVRSHVEIARGVSFVVLVLLTLWQIVIVVMTLFPAETVQSHVAGESAKQEIDRQFGKLRKK